MNDWAGVSAPGVATVLDLPDASGPARDALILKHVIAGDAVYSWVPLVVSPRLTIHVMSDALKLGGVRVGAGAGLAQQVADVLGAMLLTPKVLELMFNARAITIPPETQYDATQMLLTHWFVKESQRIDAAIADAGGLPAGGIAQTVGKPWMISNLLLAHPGKSVNYGWNLPLGTANPWLGVPLYPSVTNTSLVIQQPSYFHVLNEADYAETILLMHQECLLDGTWTKLATVLADPALAPLVSHEGVLRVFRQPGVPQVAQVAAGHPSPGIGSVIVTALIVGGTLLLLA